MAKSKEQMEKNIIYSNISTVVCILCIVVTVAVCLFLCEGITTRLEKYQSYLEGEIERKTGQLLAHSKRMMEIQDNTIVGMANLIENRDGDTGKHIKRTSRYVEMLARAAQKAGYCTDILTDEYIELLVKAAPMHDIGKISVPDSILKKPGKLTEEEFECIKCHAPEGGKIVRDVLSNIEEQKYIDIAAQVAAGHHEKWNGTGYPLKLKGEQIPISARIMAIADVFDALVSKRCYKEPMTAEEAFNIIEQSSGSHFDPVLAGLFISLKQDVVAVMNED
jgi:response regulator RpfG family c-di-GMP phosphodiesterase